MNLEAILVRTEVYRDGPVSQTLPGGMKLNSEAVRYSCQTVGWMMLSIDGHKMQGP